MPDAERQIAYDVTHLVSRLDRLATSGIDRVDLVYARYLTRHGRIDCGVHYGYWKPHRFAPQRVSALLDRIERKLSDDDESPSAAWGALRGWVLGGGRDLPIPPHSPTDTWRGSLRQSALRVATDGPFALPKGAIYLNVAQHAFEFPRFFRWLDERPDVMSVFLVHDLLPLDRPEYFRDGYASRFERRVQTILRHARAIVTTSQDNARRIQAEFEARGRKQVPLHVQPLASPLGPAVGADHDEALLTHPYFVMVSTLEPRKNHVMILNVWLALAERLAVPPKLILVGALGWDCAQPLAMITRSPRLARLVRRVSGLARADLRAVLANARALLMPSFAEGYGIPVVEALTVGTPVLASNLPIFREVTQGCAEFLSPLNGEAWLSRIADLALQPRRASVPPAFEAPTWPLYFSGVERFLATL